jgi:hypothetical protein
VQGQVPQAERRYGVLSRLSCFFSSDLFG